MLRCQRDPAASLVTRVHTCCYEAPRLQLHLLLYKDWGLTKLIGCHLDSWSCEDLLIPFKSAMPPAASSGAANAVSEAVHWANTVSDTASAVLPTPELPQERRDEVR